MQLGRRHASSTVAFPTCACVASPPLATHKCQLLLSTPPVACRDSNHDVPRRRIDIDCIYFMGPGERRGEGRRSGLPLFPPRSHTTQV